MWKCIISEMSSAYLEQMYFGGGVCLLLTVDASMMLGICVEGRWGLRKCYFCQFEVEDLRFVADMGEMLRFWGSEG